jgi:hypothetical protein
MNHKILFSILLLGVFSVTLVSAQPRLSIEKDSIGCGEVRFCAPVTVQFELRNRMLRSITIERIETSCGCTTVDYPHSSISLGQRFTVTAIYDAAMLGHFYKEFAVFFKGYDKPVYLRMTGNVLSEVEDLSTVYPYKIGDMRIDKNDVLFDNVNRGDKPVVEIQMMNKSLKAYEPVIMHLPAYLRVKAVPSVIPRGKSGKILLILDSEKLHDYGLTQTSVYLSRFPGDKVCHETEISVSAVLLPDFKNITASARQYAPKMQLSSTALNLGSFGGKSKKSGTITITNTGHTDLDVTSLQVFTAGIEVSLDDRVIHPGAMSKLKITAEQKYLRDARSKPRVLMITNDPSNSKAVIEIDIKD